MEKVGYRSFFIPFSSFPDCFHLEIFFHLFYWGKFFLSDVLGGLSFSVSL